jgi:para-nitrobenzyl esterase
MPCSTLSRQLILAALVSFFTTAAYAGAQSCPALRVKQGSLQGACDAKVASYKGIPYAQPPVDDLRWKPPQPALSWTGTRSATEFSASCIQALGRERLPWTKPFMVQNDMAEDCLTLNVWTPRSSSHQALPVYMFLHGGGHVEGSGGVAVYDGRNLATHGLVVVTINYRLGYLGFLAHPELTAESPNHASGNYGLLDAIAALKWIQENIRQFGGDPTRVTIGGQSAGSSMVHLLTASPLARGLFVNAIAESGSRLQTDSFPTQAQAEQAGAEMAHELGANSLAEMRKLPASDFLPSHVAKLEKGADFHAVDNVDGWTLLADEPSVYAQGQENQVHWLTGMQSDEGSSDSNYGKLTADVFRKQSMVRYGNLASRFFQLYPPNDPDSQKQSVRDREMASMYLWATVSAKTIQAPIHTYYFSEQTPWPEHPEYAAFHTSEIPYDFDNLDKAGHPYNDVDHRISQQMVHYWVDFFRTGDPNGGQLPKWRAARPGIAVTMEIGPKTGTRSIMSPVKLAFWTDYYNSPVSKNTPVR